LFCIARNFVSCVYLCEYIPTSPTATTASRNSSQFCEASRINNQYKASVTVLIRSIEVWVRIYWKTCNKSVSIDRSKKCQIEIFDEYRTKMDRSNQKKKIRSLSLQTSLVIHRHIKSACKILRETSSVNLSHEGRKNFFKRISGI